MRSRHSVRARLAGLLAVAIATSGLVACKGNANDTGGGGGGGSDTLTIQGDAGNPTLVRNFSPFATTQLGGSRLIYEPLEIPSQVDGSFVPFLATGHKFSNATTLVFTIRTGVKWSDGQDFTPNDVVFTYNMLKKYPAMDSTGVWTVINNVTSSGNDVTMTFKQANVPFVNTIAQVPIVPEHLWSKVSDPAKYANPNPIGTGPFTLDKYADTQYQLKKNDKYWQADKIAPKTVIYPAQSTNQSTNQLDVSAGKYDWSYNFLPDVKKTYVAKDPKHNIYWFPPGGTIALYFNLTKAPWTDANVRKGVSLALNRQDIATKAVNGYTGPASQSGLILPNLQKYLDSSIPNQGVITQSQSDAKAAFAQAGYTSSGGKLVKGGKQLSMTLELPGGYTDWVAAAKEVQNQLQSVGMKVTLDLPQAAQYTNDTQNGDFDVAFGGYGGNGDVYKDFNSALNSAFATPLKTPTANNFSRYKDTSTDQALQSLASATDQSAQMDAAHKLEQIMFTQTPMVLMYYGGSWGLFRTKNFTGWPSADDPYTLPTTYTNAVLVVLTHLKKA